MINKSKDVRIDDVVDKSGVKEVQPFTTHMDFGIDGERWPNPPKGPPIKFDLYLEKPVSLIGFYKNRTQILGVTSQLYVFNVGSLHLSCERLTK